MLQVSDLHIQFDTDAGVVHAVRGVSFDVQKGETLAIVGESGCGKSVLCKGLLGLLPPNAHVTQGEVRLKGQTLTQLSEKALCAVRGRRIAMVFQDPQSALDPSMSIGGQLVESIRCGRRCTRREAYEQAVAWLQRVGIDHAKARMHEHACALSGGMRQRCVIAMALCQSPDVLVVDEPTTALDVTVQAQILSLLRALQRETGVAIVFITHDLSVVAQIAHRVAVMYAGQVVEMGTVQDVFYDPRHPYTWGLLAALPQAQARGKLFSIPGAPPDLLRPMTGDAFAPRNPYALNIDFAKAPPAFAVSETHWARTWLLHPDAPRVECPVCVRDGRVHVAESGWSHG